MPLGGDWAVTVTRHRDRRVVGWGPQGGEKLFPHSFHLFIHLLVFFIFPHGALGEPGRSYAWGLRSTSIGVGVQL